MGCIDPSLMGVNFEAIFGEIIKYVMGEHISC